MKNLYILLLATLAVVGCNQNGEAPVGTSEPTPAPMSKPVDPRIDRTMRIDSFFADATSVVEQTGDTEAKTVLEFAITNAVYAVATGPDALSKRIPTPAPKKPFKVAVVTEEDAALGEPWASTWAGREQLLASYQRGPERSIVLLADSPDAHPSTRGIFFLHELWHAKRDKEMPHADTVAAFVTEEIEAFVFQDRLALKLAGAPLTDLVERCQERLTASLKTAKPNSFLMSLPEKQRFMPTRDELYVTLPELMRSNTDRDFWFSLLERQVIRRTTESLYTKAESMEIRRQLMELIYRANGTIPSDAE